MGIVGAVMVPHPPLIVPEVGRGGEAVIRETTEAYHKAAKKVAELKPELIIISSPHTVMYADFFHISPGWQAQGSFAAFRAPEVQLEAEYDHDFVIRLSEEAAKEGIAAGILGEKDPELDHGTMVPLYFIRQYWQDFQIVRLGLSGFPLKTHYRYGQLIQWVAKESGRRTVFVASGDLSHKLQTDGPYGFDASGPVYDERIMEVMGSGRFDQLLDFEETFLQQCAECGHRSFVIMAGALDRLDVRIEKLSHQDVTGVGYGICTYEVLRDGVANEQRAFLQQWEQRQG